MDILSIPWLPVPVIKRNEATSEERNCHPVWLFDMDTVLWSSDMAIPLPGSVAGATALLEHVRAPEFSVRVLAGHQPRQDKELGGICSEAVSVLLFEFWCFLVSF